MRCRIARMSQVMLALIAIECCLLLFANAQRSTVPIDFGWRTATAPRPACSYTIPILGFIENSGWDAAGNSSGTPPREPITTEAECMSAACKVGAQAYSFCPAGGTGCNSSYNQDWKGPGPHCIIGSLGRVFQHKATSAFAGWTTRARNTNKGPDHDVDEMKLDYDDSAWEVVDLPHDASITKAPSPNADGPEGFVSPCRQWYRKRFRLPYNWSLATAITLEVDAAMTTSSWWINGVQIVPLKRNGYLPLTVRLDNISGANLRFGAALNVLGAHTDNAVTTGWWYEGSGLVRHARIVAAPSIAWLPSFAVSSTHAVTGLVTTRATPAQGSSANSAIMPTAVVATDSPGSRVTVTWSIVNGAEVLGSANTTASAPGTFKSPPIHLSGAELWSVARPFLYTLVTRVTSANATAVDSVNTTIGIRELVWDAAAGLRVNSQRVKMRGFCDHESFAAVGAALPPRIDLLRVQQLRGVGGNAWRTSHNPPEPALLDITDRLGVLVLDENRVFATTGNCNGTECAHGSVPSYDGDVPAEAGRLALRDRNHASVAWWSLCNELGCGPATLLANDTAVQCQTAIHSADTSRAITGNIAWQYGASEKSAVAPGTPLSQMVDVMGMSHQKTDKLVDWHAAEPDKLVVMTECCSCPTQRGEDTDLLDTRPPALSVFESNEDAACMSRKTQISNAPEWVGGTFVWTLHDYLGEPDRKNRWPHISSSYGSFDLSGFPKAPVWWFRSWWLAHVAESDAGRPPLDAGSTSIFCRIVESWQRGKNSTRTINVYTNANNVTISVNGEVISSLEVSPYGHATFYDVLFAAGNITAHCADASHTRFSWRSPARIELTMDAPSTRTGTGSAVYLDGQDVALIRATIVDGRGVVVRNSVANVTFTVLSGPARVLGCGNGDPADRHPQHAAWKPAYHGLVRVILQTTVRATGSLTSREIEAMLNPDAGSGVTSSKILLEDDASKLPLFFSVAADSPGMPRAMLQVPVSVDPQHSPLSSAAANIRLADIGE